VYSAGQWTESRGVVAFEGLILGVLRRLEFGLTVVSVARGVELGH